MKDNKIEDWKDVVVNDKDNKWGVNPKMLLTKEELGLKDNRVPEYYKGKNGYEARKVCDNFELNLPPCHSHDLHLKGLS